MRARFATREIRKTALVDSTPPGIAALHASPIDDDLAS
jgi:hypothetical protein